MNRREVITLFGGTAVAWPRAALAQPSEAMPHVSYLSPGSEDDTQRRFAVFREELKNLGWADGRNIRFDVRWGATSSEKARAAAAEIVRQAPSVIVAQGSLTSEALGRETRTIPIVFASASDPVSSGLVASMAHPGGNLTGFTNFEFPMGGKWLETLKEVDPGIKRVLVTLAPGNIGNQGLKRAVEAAAPALGVQVVADAVLDASEIERAITAFAQETNGGLLVLPNAQALANRDLIIALAARHRLPAIYPYREFIAGGGLMSYDTDVADIYRRAAGYIDRILKGEKPGDLPVQVPTKYELVINLKVAKALGLTVPLTLLARADEVIE